MHLYAITRLRVSFFALAFVLLAPLVWLFCSVEQRVEAQRRLRHQVVAERIFDEVERELTLLLDRESARPSGAYDLGIRSEEWAGFVVGYFKIDGGRQTLLSESRLDGDRRSRILWALARLDVASAVDLPVGSTTDADTQKQAPLPRGALAPKSPSQTDVLRNLNRAVESRSRGTQQQRQVSPVVEAF